MPPTGFAYKLQQVAIFSILCIFELITQTVVEISGPSPKFGYIESARHYIENHPWDQIYSKGAQYVVGTLKFHFQNAYEHMGRC